MNLGLSLLMSSMKSDLDILETLKEMDYDSEACEAAIPLMNDLDVLYELVKDCYYYSPDALGLVVCRIIELEEVKSKVQVKVYA